MSDQQQDNVTTVKWLDGMTFVGIDSTNHSVVLSTTDEGVGMKPAELLRVALGSCTAVDIISIMAKKRQPIMNLEISVTSKQDTEGWPRPYTAFHIHYKVYGIDLKEDDVRKAIELSEGKYCSVAATLRPGAEITWDFEVISAKEPETVS